MSRDVMLCGYEFIKARKAMRTYMYVNSVANAHNALIFSDVTTYIEGSHRM